jgi:TolA-binding protein
MKKILLAVVLAFACSAAVHAQTKSSAEQTAGLKEFLGDLWGKLRAVTPRSEPPPATTATVTAGLRGSEATESELRPYWRGDRDQDPAVKKERVALERAQALADGGKYAEAAGAFDAFVQQNPTSSLAPNARFGSALSRAAMGDRARATNAFEDFIKRDPKHPLARDAERALAALR